MNEERLKSIDSTLNYQDKRIEELEKQMETLLQEMKSGFQNLENKLDEFTHISIYNGGGREIEYKRNVFFQYIYDKVTFKGIFPRAAALIGFALVLMNIIQLLKHWK